eukprot:2899590-Lingulodinium_polyedra.AAC.1
MRELAYTVDRSADGVASVMARFSMPKGLLHEFQSLVLGPDAFTLVSIGRHLRALLIQAHQGSWFTLQGSISPSSASSGSKAGDPLGDALFTVIMVRMLRHIAT